MLLPDVVVKIGSIEFQQIRQIARQCRGLYLRVVIAFRDKGEFQLCFIGLLIETLELRLQNPSFCLLAGVRPDVQHHLLGC